MGANKNSSVFYNKTKGEMEYEVLQQNLKNTRILRPSTISGNRNERRTLEKIVLKDHIVCATGGGIVEEEVNHKILNQSFCIYLDTSLDILHERIKHDNSRPLLLAGDKKDLLRNIFNNRKEKYKSLSKLSINTDNVDISDSCKTIMEYINE